MTVLFFLMAGEALPQPPFWARVLIARVRQLQNRVEELEAKLAYMRVELGEFNDLNGPHVIIEGANVHVLSGSGFTDNGGSLTVLGNLIVGYNEVPGSILPGDRGGAHNMVIGRQHRFRSFAGLVAGFSNTISGEEASVTGGLGNRATEDNSSISGGAANEASGYSSSVSGGRVNEASGGRNRSVDDIDDWRAGNLLQNN